jgi:nicotinate (nicotinamide) nucleotide adenylyltransferase
LNQTLALVRYRDIPHLREEAGDLLASVIQLANECGWKPEDLIADTLEKINLRKFQYQSLGRKMQIALLGGAFNPITNGHIQTAQYILDTSRTFDEVWLMPCYGHMHNKEMRSPEERLAMCKLAAMVDRRIRVFDYEIKHQLGGETYCLVKKLLVDPTYTHNYDFSIAIGMDNALTFENWVNYADLERSIRFVVVPRQGYAFRPGWFLRPPHIYLHGEAPISGVSSTDVRKWAAENNNEMLAKNLDANVLDFMRGMGSYGMLPLLSEMA